MHVDGNFDRNLTETFLTLGLTLLYAQVFVVIQPTQQLVYGPAVSFDNPSAEVSKDSFKA